MTPIVSITLSGYPEYRGPNASRLNPTQSPSTPSFILTSNPAFVSLDRVSQGHSNITLTSVAGFTGTVALADAVSFSGTPPNPGLPFVLLATKTVFLAADSSNSTTLTFNPNDIGNFVVNVTGTSAGQSHSVLVIVQVVGFILHINSSGTNLLVPGGSGTATLAIEAENGFSRTVIFNAKVALGSGLTLSLSAPSVTGAGSVTLTLTAASWASGTYRIDIDARSGRLDWSDFILVDVGTQQSSPTPPPPPLLLFGLPATITGIAVWLLIVVLMVRRTWISSPSSRRLDYRTF